MGQANIGNLRVRNTDKTGALFYLVAQSQRSTAAHMVDSAILASGLVSLPSLWGGGGGG